MRGTKVIDLLLKITMTLRMYCVVFVVKHSVQVVARSHNKFNAQIWIVYRTYFSDNLIGLVVIPVEAEEATVRVISYFFK